MTQPLDVLKTRAMNAKPGEFKVRLVSTCLFHHLHLKIPSRSCESIFTCFTCLFFILCRIWCIWSRTRPNLDLWDSLKVTSRLSSAWHHRLFWPSYSLSSFVNTLDICSPNEMFECNDSLGLLACYLFTNDGRATNISKTLTTTTKGA